MQPVVPVVAVESTDSSDSSDSSDSEDDVPVAAVPVAAVPDAGASAPQPPRANVARRVAFNEFIFSSLGDLDDSLWDAYTLEALKLLVEYKRRSSELDDGAPAAKKLQK